ncbi:MAG: F-type H+-transporting ATPase subunit b [Bacteroidia bacterium]|jgi:F-type H+-transporting ATPase subunit b
MILLNLLAAPLGLIIWTSLAFIIVLVLLKKLAWKPILKTLQDRNDFIEKSLKSAEEAQAQMGQLKSDNEKLLADARIEREKMLKEARETKESIIAEAKKIASSEGERLVSNARQEIEKEKANAMSDITSQVAALSIDIAEKVLRSELSNKDKQTEIVEEHLKQSQLS